MFNAPVRAVTGAPVTVSFTSVDSTGEPSVTDPGVVTVGVIAADGSSVVAPGAATSGTGATRTYTLSAAQTANLNRLAVTWTASASTIGTTTVDVVGNVYATISEIRSAQPSLADTVTNPDPSLLAARAEVETLFERAVGETLSFVPRFDTATMYHRGERMLRLPHYFLRRIRWARYWDIDAWLDVDTDLLTPIGPNDAGCALLYDESESWPAGRLVVGYEHGMDAPPLDVKRQAIAAIRRQVNQARTAIEARAISYTTPTGEFQRFPTPGLGPWVTGVPEVDEVLQWYRAAYSMSRVG